MMEPYPLHYSRRPKNDDDAAFASIDPNIKFMLEELQKMEIRLGYRIEGRCVGIEHHLEDAEQKAEARFISLEMGQAELEHWRPEIEKKVDSVKLEVNHLNNFLERESLERPGSKSSILSGSASARPSAWFTADGPNGHHFDNHHRDYEFGSSIHTRILGTGMNNESHHQ
ncbi:hypothetical protein PR202_ga09483 [Eleusine coracana subsp. coracana]|uniref:Uncharacterized protein n=1 Tax=Eleusine coracana subsp. coracana TaxID=191504 RepID=A0AAV5C4D9_ELECO|nr:hypothetical protein PR202_ga09483 [Eleusine coracana subsp. coracana]